MRDELQEAPILGKSAQKWVKYMFITSKTEQVPPFNGARSPKRRLHTLTCALGWQRAAPDDER